MKRLTYVLTVLFLASSIPATAQLKVFNHLGADLSVSTTGIGIELSSPITPFVQMRAGLSIMPGFSFSTNLDGTVEVMENSGLTEEDFELDVTASLKRVQGDIIFNIYPFGKLNSFFLAAGAYFGGNNIISLKGYSPEVEQLQNDGELKSGWVEVGDYKVEFEDGGNLRGALRANTFRPYLGLGFGRPCPGHRLGFMIEAGVQFMGRMKICQGKSNEEIRIPDFDSQDDWQKWMDKLTVYPVLKLTLSGKIL